MSENRLLDEALKIRRKRFAMKIGYNLTALIVGIIGFGGMWYFYGWKAALFILLILWANNLSNTSKEL